MHFSVCRNKNIYAKTTEKTQHSKMLKKKSYFETGYWIYFYIFCLLRKYKYSCVFCFVLRQNCSIRSSRMVQVFHFNMCTLDFTDWQMPQISMHCVCVFSFYLCGCECLQTLIVVRLHAWMSVCWLLGRWLLFIIFSWGMQYKADCFHYAPCCPPVHSHACKLQFSLLVVYHPTCPLAGFPVCSSRCSPQCLPLRL